MPTGDNNTERKEVLLFDCEKWTKFDYWMWEHHFLSRFIILIEALIIVFILNLIFHWESIRDCLEFIGVAFIVGTCWCIWAKFVIWFKGP